MISLSISAFLQGLSGIIHCPLMCGPFAHISQVNSKNPKLSLFLYNLSRVAGYTSVGLAMGILGRIVNLLLISQAAAAIAALMLVAYGIMIWGGVRISSFPSIGAIIPLSLKNNDAIRPLVLGVCSAFLPCGLLIPAYALSLGAGTPLTGALVMFVFGLGTIPSVTASGILQKNLIALFPSPTARKALMTVAFSLSFLVICYRLIHSYWNDICGYVL